MGILSLFQKKQKNTQVVLKRYTSLKRAADSILSQRGKQIVDGLNKTTARKAAKTVPKSIPQTTTHPKSQKRKNRW